MNWQQSLVLCFAIVLGFKAELMAGNSCPCNPCIADCDGNGNEDSCDIADGTHADCNNNTIPDVCELDAVCSGFCQTVKLAGLGLAVSVSSDIIVAGKNFTDDCSNCGEAHVFRRDGNQWLHETVLVADKPSENDRFGRSVAAYGNKVVVGASGEGDGVVYIYRHEGTSWELEARLVPSDIITFGTDFGRAVALHGTRLAIGTTKSVYVFEFDGLVWMEQARVTALNSTTAFASSFSLDGDTLVAGDFANDANGTRSGAVHVFRNSNKTPKLGSSR